VVGKSDVGRVDVVILVVVVIERSHAKHLVNLCAMFSSLLSAKKIGGFRKKAKTNFMIQFRASVNS
jgi:hypothetical protein